MKYVLLNRDNIVIDILDTIRYLKLQPFGIVIACDKDEGIGVIGSDADTHYPLIESDTTNNANAVRVMELEEIPSYVKPQEYKYEEQSNSFVNRYTLEEAKYLKQEENKTKLADYLAAHPLKWTDEKEYGITQEDQSEINLKLSQYQNAVSSGVEAPALEWHARHEENIPWSAEQLIALSTAINEAVYPLYHKMQQYKTTIFNATSIEELNAIELEYEENKNKGES